MGRGGVVGARVLSSCEWVHRQIVQVLHYCVFALFGRLWLPHQAG